MKRISISDQFTNFPRITGIGGVMEEKAWWLNILSGLAVVWVKFPMLWVLIAMMVLDFLTGVAVAGTRGEISSEKATRGAWGKLAKLSGAGASYVVSAVIPASIPPLMIGDTAVNLSLGSFVCGAFIWSEFVSNLENLNRHGLLPSKVSSILKQARGKG